MASVGFTLASLSGYSADAQESSGGFVVVLDVAKVFKENAEFDAASKEIQAEAEKLQQQMMAEQQQLQEEARQVQQTFKPGSEDFKREEARLEQEQTKLRTRARQLNEELMVKEAKLYHDTYLKMQKVVANICEENNIDLVLRFDSSDIDPENRPDVVKAVNRSVVFQRNRDITNHVIKAMGSTTAQIVPNNR